MSPIKDFIHLKQLRLSFTNYINKISGLENLTQLEVLDLSGNRIEKIEGLENLTKLKLLDLSENGLGSEGHIKKIEGLNSLKKLETLYLHHNEIKTIENIGSLTSLTRLTVGNEIDEFPDLSNHLLLEGLWIMGNFKIIPNLDFLEHLHTVSIEGDDIENPDALLSHNHLKNIEIDCKGLKGDLSTFWKSLNSNLKDPL